MYNKQFYLLTILIVCLAFIFGIIFGSAYRSKNIDQVTQFIKNSELATESYILEQELLKGLDSNCEFAKARLNTLSQDLYTLGKLLAGSTAKQDLGETQYKFLKRKFHILQIQTYVLQIKLRKNCNDESHITLFYFAQNDNESMKQGQVLDQLVSKYNLRVFAIEYNYSSELHFLEEYYNITKTPTIIFDYEKKYDSFVDYSTLAQQFS